MSDAVIVAEQEQLELDHEDPIMGLWRMRNEARRRRLGLHKFLFRQLPECEPCPCAYSGSWRWPGHGEKSSGPGPDLSLAARNSVHAARGSRWWAEEQGTAFIQC